MGYAIILLPTLTANSLHRTDGSLKLLVNYPKIRTFRILFLLGNLDLEGELQWKISLLRKKIVSPKDKIDSPSPHLPQILAYYLSLNNHHLPEFFLFFCSFREKLDVRDWKSTGLFWCISPARPSPNPHSK